MLKIDILTLFPGMVEPALRGSILARAEKAGVWALGVYDIREHGIGRHKTVDDTPYGGGSGMLMRVDVVTAAIESVRQPQSRVILLDAGGTTLTHAVAKRLAAETHLVLVCGHYEGVDARVQPLVIDEVLSIGDFVLTGGELAACVVTDAVVRLLPGALGDDHSAVDESFAAGLLEYPHYTRPAEFRGLRVPDVLVSGHHGKVAEWRRAEAIKRTRESRPDLAVPTSGAATGGPASRVKKDTDLG